MITIGGSRLTNEMGGKFSDVIVLIFDRSLSHVNSIYAVQHYVIASQDAI